MIIMTFSRFSCTQWTARPIFLCSTTTTALRAAIPLVTLSCIMRVGMGSVFLTDLGLMLARAFLKPSDCILAANLKTLSTIHNLIVVVGLR